MVMAIDAEPLRLYRRRRQSVADTTGLESAKCPIQCTWSFSQAWSKAISFEVPTVNMVDDDMVVKTNGTFGVMCSLYLQYKYCIRACAAGNADFQRVVDASPTYAELCKAREGEFDSYMPCVSNNTKTFQRVCQSVNENLLAGSIRLTTDAKFTSPIVRQFCSAANEQAYCIFPVLRQTCGDGPYDALRSIINATLTGIRTVIDDKMIDSFFPECGVYFDTIAQGVRSGVSDDNSNNMTTTIDMMSTTAASPFSSNDNTTNTVAMIIQRDDGNGSIYGATGGRWAGTNYQTTTQSSGGSNTIYLNNLFLFSTIWVIYLFS